MLRLKASQIAEQTMKKGGNCCEAVLAAANAVWGLNLDEDVLASAVFFEEGMNSGCTCGALVGMIMVSGILHKKRSHPLGEMLPKRLHDRFKEEFGSTCCRVILNRRPILQKMRSKAACIALTSRAAAMLAEEWEGMGDDQKTGICNNSNT